MKEKIRNQIKIKKAGEILQLNFLLNNFLGNILSMFWMILLEVIQTDFDTFCIDL
jgi:hypothetical protein